MHSITSRFQSDAQAYASGIRILRLPEVIHRTGFKRSSIYQMIQEGRFPRPVKLGARAVGWDSSSIDSWIKQRIDLSMAGCASVA